MFKVEDKNVRMTSMTQPENLLKRASREGIFLWILGNFQEHLFDRTLPGGCFWSSLTAIFLLL